MTIVQGRALTVYCEGPHDAEVHVAGSAGHRSSTMIHFAALDQLRPYAEFYGTLLDQSEVDRLNRFRFDADRERFLLGHGALRSVLGSRVGVEPRDLSFDRGRFGKPVLTDHPLPFNLSDTKDAIAIAVGEDQVLGVDVETVARAVDHVSVGEHYFTKEEQAAIASAPDGKRRFLEFWTRKEAVLKASGVGIMDDLKVLRVDQAVNRMTILHHAFIDMAEPEYHVGTWHIGSDHIVSLATPGPCAVTFRRIAH